MCTSWLKTLTFVENTKLFIHYQKVTSLTPDSPNFIEMLCIIHKLLSSYNDNLLPCDRFYVENPVLKMFLFNIRIIFKFF